MLYEVITWHRRCHSLLPSCTRRPLPMPKTTARSLSRDRQKDRTIATGRRCHRRLLSRPRSGNRGRRSSDTGQDRQGLWNRQQPPTRITSYNVCYTKLLRAGIQVGPIPVPGIEHNILVLIDDVDNVQLDSQLLRRPQCIVALRPCTILFANGMGMAFDANRITSYNVCYTKLLRPSHAQNPPRCSIDIRWP